MMENENGKNERMVMRMAGWRNGMGKEIEIIHHIINHNTE